MKRSEQRKRDEALELLQALRDKMKKVEPLLMADRSMAFIHGCGWPAGDEWNWEKEVAAVDAFLASLKRLEAKRK